MLVKLVQIPVAIKNLSMHHSRQTGVFFKLLEIDPEL